MTKQNKNVADTIKEGAGAAFHATHQALEATENAAMTAVDKTADAIDDLTENNDKNK